MDAPQFCELADLVFQMSDCAKYQESVRLHAAQFLVHSGDIFKIRCDSQSCELSIHMRYGLVQVLNTALVLLQDEHPEIRTHTVNF